MFHSSITVPLQFHYSSLPPCCPCVGIISQRTVGPSLTGDIVIRYRLLSVLSNFHSHSLSPGRIYPPETNWRPWWGHLLPCATVIVSHADCGNQIQHVERKALVMTRERTGQTPYGAALGSNSDISAFILHHLILWSNTYFTPSSHSASIPIQWNNEFSPLLCGGTLEIKRHFGNSHYKLLINS